MRTPNPIRQAVIRVKTPKAKSTFTLHNPQQFDIVLLEPEQLFQETEGGRCDFVFQVANKPLEIYVELKGSDIQKAIEQLTNTIRLLRSSLQPKRCYIVIWQGAPPNSNTQIQNQKLAFERRHKCKLEWKTQHGNHRL